jgi:sulfatase maturation enzyme AslB (radical SAM superfamily)
MKPLEVARNWVETNRALGYLYSLLGQFPMYRLFIDRLIQNHIDGIKKTRSYEIMIDVSSVCNASCYFCPNKSMIRKKGIMTDDIFNLIIERVRSEDIHPPIFVLYQSGEPLTDRKLLDKVRLLKAQFPSSKVSFTTNF